MKEQWPTGRKNVRKERQTRDSMAPPVAGAMINRERQREKEKERKREIARRKKREEKSFNDDPRRPRGGRRASRSRRARIASVSKLDGSRRPEVAKKPRRILEESSKRPRRRGLPADHRTRNSSRFSRTKTRECTPAHHLVLSVFAHDIRGSMNFSPASNRASCAVFRSGTREGNRGRGGRITQSDRREIGRRRSKTRLADARGAIHTASCSRVGKVLFQLRAVRRKMSRDSMISGTTGARSRTLVISGIRASINPPGKRA